MTRSRDIADQQDNLGGAVAPFVAGKNRIINGDFSVNQRGFSSITATAYSFDRWRIPIGGDGTTTATAQTFTPGSAPVAGYESKNFIQIASTGQTATNAQSALQQRLEDVRTFAGQTITISFWAKAASGTPKIAVDFSQAFGSGGSPSSAVETYVGQVTLSTSWARYSLTLAVPSISGKTIGTTAGTDFVQINLWTSAGSTFDARTGSLGIQTATIGIWGVQVEAGSQATPFTTASGSIGGELALCQRYYYRHTQTVAYERFAFGQAVNTNSVSALMPLKATMRTNPSAIEYSGLTAYDQITQSSAATAVTLTIASPQQPEFNISGVGAGLTQFRAYEVISAGTSGSYIAFSAEL